MTQAKLNRMIARILAAGLCLAIVLLLVGVILDLAGRAPSAGESASLEDMTQALAAFEPAGFYYLGLLVLLATPVAGVAALAVGFARGRWWVFCSVSLFVLARTGAECVSGSAGLGAIESRAMTIFLLIVALAVILAGCELFCNGVEWFGRKLNLGEGAVGSVLAAVGTALPETIIPLIAILVQGATRATRSAWEP